jgi:hypothetical protein
MSYRVATTETLDDDHTILEKKSLTHDGDPTRRSRGQRTDNIDVEENEESNGLLSGSKNKVPGIYKGGEELDKKRKVFPRRLQGGLVWIVPSVMLGALAVTFLTNSGGNKSNKLRYQPAPNLPVHFQCPKSASYIEAENFDEQMKEGYEIVSRSITSDMEEFKKTFRETNFDDWGHTYEEVKDGMRHFKSTYYPPYLKDGATIYESACGIGLNLYMTLEILHETSGLENLIVYGNELFGASVAKANTVYDHIGPAKSQKGVICTANSAHLDFVPEKSFDLVYTGYLYPLMDPLNLGFGQEGVGTYEGLCEGKENLEAARTIADVAQKRQNDWYGHWVAEMSRIAKLGVPVIVEQVSQPKCDDFGDWGGVPKEWWIESATNNTYGWNVDPSSLAFEDDSIFGGRYHVFMLKKGSQGKR